MGSVMMLSNHYSLSRAMRNENSIQLNKLLNFKIITMRLAKRIEKLLFWRYNDIWEDKWRDYFFDIMDIVGYSNTKGDFWIEIESKDWIIKTLFNELTVLKTSNEDLKLSYRTAHEKIDNLERIIEDMNCEICDDCEEETNCTISIKEVDVEALQLQCLIRQILNDILDEKELIEKKSNKKK